MARNMSTAGTITKVDLADAVRRLAGIPKEKARIAVEALFNEMAANLAAGYRIEVRGFGALSVFLPDPKRIPAHLRRHTSGTMTNPRPRVKYSQSKFLRTQLTNHMNEAAERGKLQ